jgi:hypothetical protein
MSRTSTQAATDQAVIRPLKVRSFYIPLFFLGLALFQVKRAFACFAAAGAAHEDTVPCRGCDFLVILRFIPSFGAFCLFWESNPSDVGIITVLVLGSFVRSRAAVFVYSFFLSSNDVFCGLQHTS